MKKKIAKWQQIKEKKNRIKTIKKGQKKKKEEEKWQQIKKKKKLKRAKNLRRKI